MTHKQARELWLQIYARIVVKQLPGEAARQADAAVGRVFPAWTKFAP